MGRPPVPMKPSSPIEIEDILDALKDKQRAVSVCLGAWLQKPTDISKSRLTMARRKEAELLDLFLNPPTRPSRAKNVSQSEGESQNAI